MAVEILNPGKGQKDLWVYFECDRCGCQFRVTMDETDQTYLNDFYMYLGECPICHKRLCGSADLKEC